MTSTELKHQANLQQWSQDIRKRRIYPRINCAIYKEKADFSFEPVQQVENQGGV